MLMLIRLINRWINLVLRFSGISLINPAFGYKPCRKLKIFQRAKGHFFSEAGERQKLLP
jgi:hypothetical protein